MKVVGAVVLVLLGFAALFMTFLVAPLAVLTAFYAGFAIHASRSERTAPDASDATTLDLLAPGPDPAELPARKKRIEVSSDSERAAREELTRAAAEADAFASVTGASTATDAAPAEDTR